MTTFRHTLTAALVAASLSVAPTAHAQTPDGPAPDAPEPVVMPANMEAQVATLLDSERPDARERGMQLILHYKGQQKVDADFRAAVPHLVDLYVDGANDEERLMSLSALYALHDDAAMEALAKVVRHAPSDRARRVARLTLSQYQTDRRQTASAPTAPESPDATDALSQ